MTKPPISLRILPPLERLDALFNAEDRLLSMLGHRYPDFDFVLAQSPRPPGAGLAVVAVDPAETPAQAVLDEIGAAILALVA